MKEKYLLLMEKALSAYSNEQILNYFNTVKERGLTEHGFPRLTSTIGILIAHGKRQDLIPLFTKMMDFCCENIPKVKAANDFSVREIVNSIEVAEKAGFDATTWKEQISSISPYECYNVIAKKPDERLFNWALFTAVSEYRRLKAGLGGSLETIEIQLATQVKHLDKNGMYRDNYEYPPMTYDLVSRVLFSTLLRLGYRGKYYKIIDKALKKAGLLTLKMQSAVGEIPFGGRSNQFLFNSALLSAVCEYEATRYYLKDKVLASKFKLASLNALNDIESWLQNTPISHIKNRFSTDSKYGCETYAYFDKYMITLASFLYEGYLNCDETIKPAVENTTPVAVKTSKHFHAIFLSAGGYSLQFDINSSPHYDSNGLGRVHKKGAPSTICLSVPCPISPTYKIDGDKNAPLSLAVGVKVDKEFIFATGLQAKYKINKLKSFSDSASATLTCSFKKGKKVKTVYNLSSSGVEITNTAKGEIAYLLPAFDYDGETIAQIKASKNTLEIFHKGFVCRYTTSGEIVDINKTSKNRNGYYKTFMAKGENTLKINIEIIKSIENSHL